MSEHRYTLQRYDGMRTRYRCPGCQQRNKTFARYVDNETGEYVAAAVGRCNREDKCGYHYTPAQYFEDNGLVFDKKEVPFSNIQSRTQTRGKPSKPSIQPALSQPSFIPVDLFKQSLHGHDRNSFVIYLLSLFGHDTTLDLIGAYFIGTSNSRWPGAAVFWFTSADGKIKAGQVKLFDDSGHTAEYINHEGEKRKCTDWMHSILKRRCEKQNQPLPEWLISYLNIELKVSCFYGEHLLNLPKNKTKVIAVCESPKTAIIASAYLPQFVWLACGALSYLTEERCRVFQGRRVLLYPDISNPKPGKLTTFEKWSQRAKELSHITTFAVSDYLETYATDEEKAAGLDIADYLIQYDYREFTAPPDAPQAQTDITLPVTWCMPMVFHLSHELNHYQLATFQLSDGRLYDCLFDAANAFVTERESEEVKAVERQYNKQFMPGNFYGERCLLHILN